MTENAMAGAEMKRWYCVTSKWDDKGNGWAGVTAIIEANKKPEGTFRSTKKCDIYTDWFDSPEEAEQFVRDAKKA